MSKGKKKPISYERCLFCRTDEVSITKKKVKSRGFFLKIIQLGGTTAYDEKEMNCPICGKKFRALFLTDSNFLKKHLKFSELVLGDLIRIIPNSSRRNIIDNLIKRVIGIAQLVKKGQMFRTREFDICFKMGIKMKYLHCKQVKNNFHVLSVNEV